MKRILIGVGNSLRGDDGIGLVVAGRIRSIDSVQVPSASFEMIDLWEEADEVIVVDAARSGASPGTIHRLDALARPVPGALLTTSTHSIGVSETIELARSLGRLPPSMTIYGIEVGGLTTGTDLSPEVRRAAETLVEMIDGA